MIGYIYCYTNKVNGKKYVGQTTKNLLERSGKNGKGYSRKFKFGKAIDKYGWDNFIPEILETVEEKDELQLVIKLNKLERYWVDQYDSYNNGYNSDLGGSHHILTEEAKNKIRISKIGKDPWNKGKVGSQKAWNKNTSIHPNICMYDLKTGKLLKKFVNGYVAAKYLVENNIINTKTDFKIIAGRIGLVCKVNSGHAYSFIWRYDQNLDCLPVNEVIKENKSPRAKAILQFDLEDNFIAEYESAAVYSKTVASEYNEQRKIAHGISDACNNKTKNSEFLNYKWKFK